MDTDTTTGENAPTALLLLGCPQVPVQTSVAIYLCHALKAHGILPTIAGTISARKLIDVADPEGHYIGASIDLDACIAAIAEKERDFDQIFVFVHNDGGVSYAGTISAISRGRLIAVVYGEHAEEVAATITFPCEKVVAKAVHNPMPLVHKLKEVLA